MGEEEQSRQRLQTVLRQSLCFDSFLFLFRLGWEIDRFTALKNFEMFHYYVTHYLQQSNNQAKQTECTGKDFNN